MEEDFFMTNKQKRFFNIAREVSLLSDFKRARVGAVVVERNKIKNNCHFQYLLFINNISHLLSQHFCIDYLMMHPSINSKNNHRIAITELKQA